MSGIQAMVDIETAATSSRSAILTIGAVKFALEKGKVRRLDCEHFYVRIAFESYENNSYYEVSPETMLWWMKQTPAARDEAFLSSPRVTPKEALAAFAEWCKGVDGFWSQGKEYDLPILQNAFLVEEIECPWKYWQLYDTRTVYFLRGLDYRGVPAVGEAHTAIADCLRQLNALERCLGIAQN